MLKLLQQVQLSQPLDRVAAISASLYFQYLRGAFWPVEESSLLSVVFMVTAKGSVPLYIVCRLGTTLP